MNDLKTPFWWIVLVLVGSPFALFAQDNVVISEFMASNTRGLRDEDGRFSDWIEIQNVGTNTVNMEKWILRDSNNQWTFPATNIAPGDFIIVFATGDDRRVPGRPLHADFQLSSSGEYLALIKPDGTNITTEFNPYPGQIPNVSYGLGQTVQASKVVSNTSSARVLVPLDGSFGLTWTEQAFSDGAWLAGTNGVGFDTNVTFGPFIRTDVRTAMYNQNASAFMRLPFSLGGVSSITGLKLRMRYNDGFVAYVNGVEAARRNAPSFAIGGTLADSVADFSGIQGQNGWYYGYYDRTADTDSTYQTDNFAAFPVGSGAWSATNYWTGTIWDWFGGNPPWTELNANGGHPNGVNTGPHHWAIRRWVSSAAGTLTFSMRIAKANVSCGNGVTARVLQNGVQKYSRFLSFSDSAGINTNITIADIVVGDIFDFAIDSANTSNVADDSCDSTTFTIRVDQTASPPLDWNSTAIAARSSTQSTQVEEIDIFNSIRWLQTGPNVLAVQGLNIHATNSNFLMEAELEAGVATSVDPNTQRYFSISTPGAANGVGVGDIGPVILEVAHSPNVPLDNENILVTAQITPAFATIASNQLIYRVMYGPEVTVPMLDDGLHGDGLAGDDVYGAFIPSNISTNGEMVRWFIRSYDFNNRTSRWPLFNDPNNSPQYLGTIVYLAQTNNLPIFHWFVQSPATAATAAGTRCSIFFLDQFYDNVLFNLHGQSSSGSDFLRKPYDIDFNPGHHFKWKEGEVPVDDINFLQTYSDKAKMRNMLVYDTHKDAGAPYHFTIPVRVQQNGTYYADYHVMENGDAGFLERNGKDPNGAFYKMYNTFTAASHATPGTSNAEKKTRKDEGGQDLLALFNGVSGIGTNRFTYVWDNINIAGSINTMTARTLTGDLDCCHKNYYFYRDTEGTGEWEAMTWDVDLSFGRNWGDCSNYWSDQMHPENGLLVGNNNNFFIVLFASGTATRQMYYRRFRTLMDELLQSTNTPAAELKYERQIDEWVALIEPDAELEKYKWATWGNCSSPSTCCTQSMAFAANRIKTEFLAPRRAMLANRTIGSSSEIPNAQPTNVVLNFAAIDFNPVSGNQAEEYIQIRNTNTIAVDISGWAITGAVQHVFQGGAVIPSNSSVYVVPNKRAFRARTVPPRAGQSNYVEGEYQGQLNARGEALYLIDNRGRPVNMTNYPGNPSGQQLYLRITEIMYSPAPPDATNREDFEYIELKNIGPTNLSLVGVHFTNGIDFNFTGSAVTSLAPGESVLVVKNLAAFTARYGSGFNIAGVYGGQLNNGGERLRLDDGVGEKILEFDYNNSWYPITDGLGFSLVIVDENAPWNTWDRRQNWRPSGEEGGSPGENEPNVPAILPVLVNELVSNSENPPQDRIELYNPNPTPVNIGNWFISDDFRYPKKYRILAGTTIGANSYIVFSEAQFNTNPLSPINFAFSSTGDEAYLFSGDANTNLTGYFHGFGFAAADTDVSFGRFVTSDTNEHFVAQSQTTISATNAYPRVGPVVISEIMYHPPDRPNGQDDQDAEYIELHNSASTNVALFDPAIRTNTWRIRGGVDFNFPTNVMLTPGEYALVVSFNPTNDNRISAFRSRYGLSASVDIYGPYSGKLDNSADAVQLQRPAPPLAGEMSYVLVERVDYRDVLPWPTTADGAGPSLQRLNLTRFANEPTNWAAALSPGAAYGGTAPQITSQPFSQTVLAGTNVILSISATGTEPLVYQWRLNGVNIFGANSPTLSLSNVKSFEAGVYDAVVFNPAGSAQSAGATLTVNVPLKITGQPGNRFVQPNTSTNLSVTVTSPRPVTYQWRRNGTNILNATNAVLALANITRDNEGEYTVYVQDAVSSELSQPAILLVLYRPFFSLQPISQTLALGSEAIFTSGVSNTVPPNLPLTNRWRKGPSFAATNVLNAFTNSFVISNIQTNDGDTYTCTWANVAGSTALSASALLVVVIPPTNQTVEAGADVTFSSLGYMRSPTRPIRYQWQFKGADILDATNATLTVTNVQVDDIGTYTVLITNPQDMVTPFSAQLTVAGLNARLSGAQMLGDSSFRAIVEGAVNRTFSIEMSSDLTNWTQLRSLIMTNAAVPFTDSTTTNVPQRFYRARLAD
jgi:hypothetical protein